MSKHKLVNLFVNRERRQRPSRRVSLVELSGLEMLDRRVLPAVTATLSAAQGVLTVVGDAQDNTITVSRDALGTILVNNGAITVQGGTPTVANTRLIQLSGLGGNDNLSLNETNGALPGANIDGGDGNDTIAGGSGNDVLTGGAGNDTFRFDTDNTLSGEFGDVINDSGGGSDTLDFSATTTRAVTIDLGQASAQVVNAGLTLTLLGSNTIENVIGGALGDTITGNDLNNVIEGGGGDDSLDGGAGNDTYRFDTDNALGSDTINEVDTIFDPNSGVDTLDFSATTTRAVSIDLGAIKGTQQVVNAGLTLSLRVDTIENVIGGALGDTITGNVLNNVIDGGAGNDAIEGGGGNDTLTGGAGNDTFQWNPGDGSDLIDGLTSDGLNGSDRLVFNGSNDSEKLDISADGNGVRFTRDVDNVTLELVGVETIDGNASGGADTISVGDLSATAVTAVNLDVGPAGDGAADAVIVNGTAGNDSIELSIVSLRVIGLHAPVTLINLTSNDSLTINGGGGDDDIAAASVLAGAVKLTENGEAGNDTLTGSRGNDTLIGGDGDDFLEGFRGSDLALMGAGNDTFDWEPGDGSDTIDGQGGHDTLIFNGSNDDETFSILANGNRVSFLRSVASAANVIMDLSGVEQVDLSARGGADTITVNDLTATDLTALNLDLDSAAGNGTGDGASDSVIVNGTAGDDAIQIASFDNGTRIAIGGLFPQVNITGSDGTNDHLTVNALGGNDVVDTSSLPAGLIGLTVNLGDGQAAAVTTTTLRTSTATAVFGQTETLTATVNSLAGTPTGFVTFKDGTVILGTVPLDAAGQATFAVSLGAGNHALTAVFGGNGGFATSTSAVVAETVNQAATATVLSPSANPAVGGQTVTFTATVTAVAPGAGTPTGTVTVLDGNTVLGTAAVGADGRATLATSFAAAGGHAITAIYSGDGNFVGSSRAVAEQISVPTALAPTTTALAASANVVRKGQTVTFTATVRAASGAGRPTGTVRFLAGNVVVGRVPLNADGQASFTRRFAAKGRFVIRVVYSGDSNFAASSQSITERVTAIGGPLARRRRNPAVGG